jgi:hypothetical protein
MISIPNTVHSQSMRVLIGNKIHYVTFYVSPTWAQTMIETKQYQTMDKVLLTHKINSIPDESGGISHCDE